MFVIITSTPLSSWNKFLSLALKTMKNKKFIISTSPSLWVLPPNLSYWSKWFKNYINNINKKKNKNQQRYLREKGKDVIPLMNWKMWIGVIGYTKKTSDIIGSYRFTTNTLWIDIWGAWTKYSRQWKPLLDLGKQNSAGVIIKRCRKNITILLPLSRI